MTQITPDARARAARIAEAWGLAVPLDGESAVRVNTGGPAPRLELRRSDGTWAGLNSRRDPVREAASWLDAAAGADTVFVVGLGLGDLLDVFDRLGKAPLVVGLEADPGAVAACLSRDRDRWIAEERLAFVTGPSFDDLGALVMRRPGRFVQPAIVVNPALRRERPDLVSAALSAIGKAVAGARANETARERFAGPYLLNTLANGPRIRSEADVAALEGLGQGRTAVVIGAGPSLDASLDALRGLDRHAVLIAVDTALRPLLSAGVTPHFAVAVDPSEVNGRHLRELAGTGATWLVGEASLWPGAFVDFAGRTFLFRVGAHEPWPWLDQSGTAVGTLRAWGSVITSSVDLALALGCGEVVLTGADFMATGGQPYARGTTFETTWAERILRGGTLADCWAAVASQWSGAEAVTVDGTRAATGEHLLAFRDWILGEARSGRAAFVNASGQGILAGPHVSQEPMSAVARRLGAGPGFDLRGTIARVHQESAGRRRESRAEPPPPPRGAWRAVVATSGGTDDDLDRACAAFESEGPVDPGLGGRVVVGPPAESAAILSALWNGRDVPAWAALEASDEGSAASLAQAALAVPPPHEASDDGRSAAPPFLLSRLPGLTTDERAAIVEIEARAARLFATLDPARVTVARDGAPVDARDVPTIAPARRPAHDAARAGAGTLAMLLGLGVAGLAGWRASRRCGRLTPSAQSALALWLWRQGTLDAAGARRLTPSDGVDVAIERDGGGACGAVRASRSTLARLLTGAVLQSPHDRPTTLEYVVGVNEAGGVLVSTRAADGRARPLAGMLESIDLAPLGLPRCLYGETDPQGGATLAMVPGRNTFSISEDGKVGIRRRWPSPILREHAWGSAGGAVAWTIGAPPAILWKEHRHAGVLSQPLPFRPEASLVDEGTLYLTASGGGLWQWTPGTGPIFLAAARNARALRLTAAGLVLEPVATDVKGVTTRLPVASAQRWCRERGAMEELPLGPEGQCWSESLGAHGWVARAYPASDLIRVVRPDGASWSVVCRYPVTVAWAGSSLVVVASTVGEARLFPDVLRALEGTDASQPA